MPRDPFDEEILQAVLGREGRALFADPRDPAGGLARPVLPIGGPLVAGRPVVNVLDYAVPDGSDQTRGIQAAIDDVPAAGGVLFFPAGTWGVGSVEVLRLTLRTSITLLGTFGCSILQRVPGAEGGPHADLDYDRGPGILSITLCSDVVIAGMVFDANGFVTAEPNQRALVACSFSRGIRIERNRVLDSAPNDSLSRHPFRGSYGDAHAVGFGLFDDPQLGRPEPCEDVLIRDNVLQGWGIAVHDAKRVRVTGNRIESPLGHGIAIGGELDGAVHEDVEITGNSVTAPAAFGIAVADSGPQEGEGGPTCEARRIRVARNSVRIDSLTGAMRGIVVGLLFERQSPPVPPYPVFEDVEIADNFVELPGRSGLRPPEVGLLDLGAEGEPDSLVGVWARIGSLFPGLFDELGPGSFPLVAPEHFLRLRVTGNVVVGARSTRGGSGVVVHNNYSCEIAANAVYESTNGIDLRDAAYRCHVHDNRVEAEHAAGEPPGVPYQIAWSAGGNTFSANAIHGGRWPHQPVWRIRGAVIDVGGGIFEGSSLGGFDRAVSGDTLELEE